MKIFTKFILMFLFLLLNFSSAFAQTQSAVIFGAVTDSVSGTPLTGANIWLKGTSLGAASDLEGRYIIRGIDPGSYNLIVRYIGYKEKNLTLLFCT